MGGIKRKGKQREQINEGVTEGEGGQERERDHFAKF